MSSADPLRQVACRQTKNDLSRFVSTWNMTGETSLPLLMEPFFPQHHSTQVLLLLIKKLYVKNLEYVFVLEAYLFFTPSFAFISMSPVPLFSQNIVLFKIVCHLPISTVPTEKLNNCSLAITGE